MDWDDIRHQAFDFETSGTLPEYALQPWRMRQHNDTLITYDEWQHHYHGEPVEDRTKAWATSLVWTTHDGERLTAHGGLMPSKRDIARMLEDAIKNKRRLLGWNTTFDIMVCLGYGLEDLVMEAKFLDGMLLWRHAFIEPEYEEKGPNKKSYGLKAAVAEFMPSQAGYEEDVDFHDRDPAVRKKLHSYNMRDTAFTHACARHAWGLLNNRQRRAAMIEAESLPQVALANFRGMMVDTFATRELQAKLDHEADECLTLLAPLGVTEKIVRSPIQLGKLIFDEWKLPVLKENKSKITGNISRSTDKEVLHELSFIDPRAKTLRQYREALNNKTKFADTPLKSCLYNEDECTHPSGIIFGTYSGRMTYGSKQGKGVKAVQTGFALHQEKRGAEFRAILRAPPGYTLVEFDAAGQEFRWMAIASRDEQMLQLCRPGEDPHSFMGAAIAERDYKHLIKSLESPTKEIAKQAKSDRQLGKIANLSLQYRTSAKKLRVVARVQYDLPMELPQAERIRETYLRTYKGVPRYWEQQIAATKRNGYVETFAGRRVVVKGNWAGMFGWSMGSTAINYRIQGTGADQKYLAMLVVKDYVRSIGAYFAWDLHDGLYFYVPDDKVQEALVEMKKRLDNLPYKEAWGLEPPIPLPFDAKVGPSWGQLREHHFG